MVSEAGDPEYGYGGSSLSAERTIKKGLTEQKLLEQDPRDLVGSAMMVRVGKDSTGRGNSN